ncbi:Inter alpha-trypsin inhibitor, heavy chain 4,Inter-alpha-trypsin inhibitor heavy chain H3,Inter-alpha-trypsin inhibitor heavy chain H4 [Mytilus edulis]|uniref:Inter alpha-trypsin inhibitor, heavy chain 4,Inter-alpha-trypsin inhibitor heavy chain H3,Inter-alpha-trypsin inhibitor heavy chain H4 n=1 Tax=Mytilus edulis TaxID=6550 RepID=A0A8S3VIZ4_MYTED|nr:Inter alpha-trypsin inhibitor, heavy chain 4,Inter-alpha-trypsin inhibitor heavy chain H3,Inter-alpha-trypsin inhibitor heavy chain H4 [Mytilus edulis]
MDGTMIMHSLIVISFLNTQIVHSKTQNPRIYYMHIKSDVKFRFATTLVTSKVANSAKASVEAHFEVTLPDAAFITKFDMEIDGQVYPGEINEKATAKEKYDTAKKKGQSAGHVAQKPRHTNRFSVDVNVAAESKVAFNLTYQELLERVYEQYEHIIYVAPGQIVEDFKIDVYIHESRDITKVSVPPLRNDIILGTIEEKNALAIIERPTQKSATIHYAPTADDQKHMSDKGISGLFVVEYDVQRTFDAGEVMVVDGYFVHFFAPEGMDPLPKDVLFILDVSGSMSGTKIAQQKSAMNSILKDLFEVLNSSVLFSDIHNPLSLKINCYEKQNDVSHDDEMPEEKIKRWENEQLDTFISNIDRLKVNEILAHSTEMVEKTSENSIINKVVEDVCHLLTNAAKSTFGTFTKRRKHTQNIKKSKPWFDSECKEARKKFRSSRRKLKRNHTNKKVNETKKLANVTENATKRNFDTFFNGKELVIAGKLSDDNIQVLNLLVTGNGVNGNVELELKSDIQRRDPELTKAGDFEKITERIWAYLTIKQLLEEAIGETNELEKKNLNDRALAMSLKYKFVTPLTSMVVTKPDERDLGDLEENEDARLALSKVSSTKTTSSASKNNKRTSAKRKGDGGGGGGRGYSSGGGGGGDPHFMLKINGIEFPICFDVDTRDGDVIRMLKDPIAGITINAGIVRSTMKKKDGEFKTFIGEIVILAPASRIHIKPDKITFNGDVKSWNDEGIFEMEGSKIHIYGNALHERSVYIGFENNVSIEIRRPLKDGTERDVSYLNMYIDNEKGVSNMAGGILGQFVHKKTSLFKIGMDKRGRQHGHFRETENTNKTHFNAVLHMKPDIITGEMVWCWNVYKKTEGLLAGDLKDYFISDIDST